MKETLSLLIPLIVLVISPFLSLYIAKKQITATVLSNQRKEWINEFRLNVSKLMSLAMSGTISYPLAVAQKDQKTVMENFAGLSLLQFQIKLMLNLDKPDHAKLDEVVTHLVSLVSGSYNSLSIDLISADLGKITNLARSIMKDEHLAIKE